MRLKLLGRPGLDHVVCDHCYINYLDFIGIVVLSSRYLSFASLPVISFINELEPNPGIQPVLMEDSSCSGDKQFLM